MISITTLGAAVKVMAHMEHNSLGQFNVFVAFKAKELMTKEYYDAHLPELLTEFLNQ